MSDQNTTWLPPIKFIIPAANLSKYQLGYQNTSRGYTLVFWYWPSTIEKDFILKLCKITFLSWHDGLSQFRILESEVLVNPIPGTKNSLSIQSLAQKNSLSIQSLAQKIYCQSNPWHKKLIVQSLVKKGLGNQNMTGLFLLQRTFGVLGIFFGITWNGQRLRRHLVGLAVMSYYIEIF